MTIAGYTIPQQAFINITEISGLDTCSEGICGLLGLGFDSPTAGIEEVLTAAGLDGPKLGKSVLSSIFDMNPDKGRFFALSLSRLNDPSRTADASLAIAEYDPNYAAVQWMAKRPVFPATAKSWDILCEGVAVNGISVPWPQNNASTANGTPAGQHRVSLDTGTTNFLFPPAVRSAIYSLVPGAVLATNSSLRNVNYAADRDVWVVPCTTPVNFTTIFGGQPYPIHPLDMTVMTSQKGPDGVTYTYCVAAVTNGGSLNSGTTDAMFGDSFMRSNYIAYNFGDNTTTTPYVQILSTTNEWDAGQDFANVRTQQLVGATELAPADLIHLFDGVSVGGSGSDPIYSSFSSAPGSPTGGSSSSSPTAPPSASNSCGPSVGAGRLANAAAVTSGADASSTSS
ncbi:aspartic peptidase domain-containing protein [Mycena galopus ATCC 62051]|nr:aspartic peptidase domain-containing protein [Mycena galopus ATCC 62051]